MRVHSLSTSVSVITLLCAASTARAQTPAVAPCAIPIGAALWSQASTWPGCAIPVAGDCVTIPPTATVYLDLATPPPLGGLDVQGTLIFLDCSNISLTTDWIHVTGRLQIGTTAQPFQHKATITLTRNQSGPGTGCHTCSPVLADGTLAAQGGGVISLHGKSKGTSWLRLAQTANVGDTSITLQSAPGAWSRNDHLVITSTDYDMNQAEEVVVFSVAGNVVTLMQPLQHMHWGATEGAQYDGVGVEERAEVGNLTRSIVIQGVPIQQASGATWAGETRLDLPSGSSTPKAEIEWVEFTNLGDEGVLGHYPAHFHLLGNGAGSYVKNSSFHHCWSRWMSIHDTDNVLAEGNVGYITRGHGWFIEDNGVVGCTLRRNLGAVTLAPRFPLTLNEHLEVSTFWLHNPANTVEDNAAGGSDVHGFWFEAAGLDPTPWTSFHGNVAHSNGDSGFFGDERPAPVPESVFTDCTSYKNRRYGYWLRTYENLRLVNCDSADNRGGYYLASEGFQTDTAGKDGIAKTLVQDSLVIGETSNLGEVDPTLAHEVATGRSLPQQIANGCCTPFPAWDALTGVEFYDGLIGIEGCTFAQLHDLTNAAISRKGGALAQVWYASPWAVDPRNYVDNCTFVNNATTVTDHVEFKQPWPGGHFTSSCCSYFVGDNGVANTVLYDKSGSITGTAGNYVFPNNAFLVPSTGATYNAAWNANVTAGPPVAAFAQFELNCEVPWWLAGLGLPTVTADRMDVAALLRPASFVCGAPVQPGPVILPRYPTNVVTEDGYVYSYPAGYSTSQYAHYFALTFQFTEPGRWGIASMPIFPPVLIGYAVYLNGVDVSAAASPSAGAFLASTTSAWWYDFGTSRIWLKFFAGSLGSGTTMYDNQSTTFEVFSH